MDWALRCLQLMIILKVGRSIQESIDKNSSSVGAVEKSAVWASGRGDPGERASLVCGAGGLVLFGLRAHLPPHDHRIHTLCSKR